MDESVLEFRNKENYCKFQMFCFQPGANVLLQTLKWLYAGTSPIEENLIELVKTNKIRKNNTLKTHEKIIIQELSEGKRKLKNVDPTLLFKIIQLKCNLAPKNDVVWTKESPIDRRNDLEHLLYKLNWERNCLAHPGVEEKDITDADVQDQCIMMKKLLAAILQEAGHKSKAEVDKINEIIHQVQLQVETIVRGEYISESARMHLKSTILLDLQAYYSCSKEMESFEKELEGYSVPYLLTTEDPQSEISLNQLIEVSDSQILIVHGGAGMGKTALTKYLFSSWLSTKTEPVIGLEKFDFAFRVECNNIVSNDVNKFYEDHLPNACYSFPNTSSMSRHFRDFKILWIMDGFDESAVGFLGFLKDLLKGFSECHKLILTTRPYMLGELQKHLKIQTFILSLGMLRSDNILQLIQYLIDDNEKRISFINEFIELEEASKILLTLPLNLILYIRLWLVDPQEAKDSYTTNKLFVKTAKHQLKRLGDRLKERVLLLTDEDLKGKIKRWFYGMLCKVSFVNIMHCKFGIIQGKDVKFLTKGANDSLLIATECLSSCLVKEKGSAGKSFYRYIHPLQQFVFAVLFVKKFEKYGESTPVGILYDISSSNKSWESQSTVILEAFFCYYVTMILELNSKTCFIEKALNIVMKLIENLKLNYIQCRLLYVTSIATSFNADFMKSVSLLSQSFPILDLTDFQFDPKFCQFLCHIRAKKIITYAKSEQYSGVRPAFYDILNFVKKNSVECHIIQRYSIIVSWGFQVENSETEIELINKEPVNITILIGTMKDLLKIENHHKNLKAAGIVIECERDIIKAKECLQKHSNLDDIKFLIDFDITKIFTKYKKRLSWLTFLTKIIVSHNQLVKENIGSFENKKSSLILAADLVKVSEKLRANPENASGSLNYEIIQSPYCLQQFEIPNS